MAAVIVLAGLGLRLLFESSGFHAYSAARVWMDLDGEWNIPAAFSFGILMLGAILSLRAARVDPERRRWIGLAALLGFFAWDEILSLHERSQWRLGAMLSQAPAPVSILFWSLGTMAFATGVWGFGRLFRSLPTSPRQKLMRAALIYLTGALGIEFLGRIVFPAGSSTTASYALLIAIEEGMEMAGALLASEAVVVYLAEIRRAEIRDFRREDLTYGAADPFAPASYRRSVR